MRLLILGLLTLSTVALARKGGVREESRPAEPFTRIEISHGIRAKVTTGGAPSVTIKGDASVLSGIKIEIADGTLRTKVDRATSGRLRKAKPVELTLVTDRLEAIDASGGAEAKVDALTGDTVYLEGSGAAEIHVDRISAKRAEVDLSGAAEVLAAGSVETLEVEVSGAGDADLKDLQARVVEVDASGSATVEVTATEEIRGDAAGAANVTVRGNPEDREISSSGGASVRFE